MLKDFQVSDKDQLRFTSPIPFTFTFGLIGFFGGAVLLYIALDWSLASALQSLVIMVAGSLMLLLRRIHEIDRRMMTEVTYLGMIIPGRGTSRNLFMLNQRSIMGFDRVIVQHEETYVSPEPGIDPGGSLSGYHVVLANDQTEISLASFWSLDTAEKHAEEIKMFLYNG